MRLPFIKQSAQNRTSGLGGISDKSVGTILTQTHLSKYMADRLYVESWFARAFVDMPVDDMFILWRQFEGDTAERMQEAETRYNVRDSLADAMKNSRKYGTGLIVMVTRDGSLTEPLMPEGVRQDDLLHLLVTDNHHAAVEVRDKDFFSPTFGRPLIYRILGEGVNYQVHHSRVLRFDGIMQPSVYGGTVYSRDWSPSPLIPAVQAAYGEQAMASAVMHLSQESSMVTVKIPDFDERVSSHGFDGTDDANPSMQQIIQEFSKNRSVYRVNAVDSQSDVQRDDVQWRGLDRIIEVNYKRLAAIAGIPVTRLLGTPPVGMNATGESDMRNYAMLVKALQENKLAAMLERLDLVVARSAGLPDAPDYKFTSLTDLTDVEKSTAAVNVATAAEKFHAIGAIDEDEARVAADDIGIFGDDLAGSPAPGEVVPEPEPQPMLIPPVMQDAA